MRKSGDALEEVTSELNLVGKSVCEAFRERPWVQGGLPIGGCLARAHSACTLGVSMVQWQLRSPGWNWTKSGSMFPNSVTLSCLLNLCNSVQFNSPGVYAGHCTKLWVQAESKPQFLQLRIKIVLHWVLARHQLPLQSGTQYAYAESSFPSLFPFQTKVCVLEAWMWVTGTHFSGKLQADIPACLKWGKPIHSFMWPISQSTNYVSGAIPQRVLEPGQWASKVTGSSLSSEEDRNKPENKHRCNFQK